MEIILFIIAAIFINNVLLPRLLHINLSDDMQKNMPVIFMMGVALTFLLTTAILVTTLLQKIAPSTLMVEYTQIILFIIISSLLALGMKIVFTSAFRARYPILNIPLPLVAANSALLGTAILYIHTSPTLWELVIYAVATSIGHTSILIIYSAINEQLSLTKVPKVMKGIPLALIITGVMAMACIGLNGISLFPK